MEEIFVSYARNSAPVAKSVADALRGEGYSVWIDEYLPAYADYADAISERVDGAKAVLVIWSDAATKSQWVRSEANRARENGTLIQMRVEPARLPMPFDQIQCVELPGWQGDPKAPGWRIILDSIRTLTGREATPAQASLTPTEPIEQSLAVMPFRDLSPGRDQSHFCEGLAEELLTTLARLPDLRVAASAATLGSDTSIGNVQIARTLRVNAYLEGSIRKSDHHARVAVRLIETRSGFTLWAESFDSDLTDIFELQDEIARAVVASLGVQILARDSLTTAVGGTTDAAAYDLYLRAKQLVRKELESEFRAAVELYQEATRRDSDFALAYAGLADVLVQIARWHLKGWEQARTEALAASERAIALAPDLAEAHLAQGGALQLMRDPGARAAFERALALNPRDAYMHYRFARFLVVERQKHEAIEHYERAFELSPDDYRYVVYTLQEYDALGDEDGQQAAVNRSWEAIERHLKLNPDDTRAYSHGAGILIRLGRRDEAREFMAKALSFRPDDYANLMTLACDAVFLGDHEQALDLCERAAATGRGDKEWLLEDNDLAPLRDHPRFKALIASMD